MEFRRACLATIVVVFTASAQDFRLWPVSPTNDEPFQIRFTAVPGLLYDIETSTNLAEWELLTTVRAQSAIQSVADPTNQVAGARFYRVADLSPNIVVEGWINTEDSAFVLVSSSLDSAATYTDADGHYLLRTTAKALPSNLPFTLYFSKI